MNKNQKFVLCNRQRRLMYFIYMVIVSLMVLICTRIKVLGHCFYDNTRSTFDKTRTALKLVGMGVCCCNNKNIVHCRNNECVSNEYISSSEPQDTECLDAPSYDTDRSDDDVYEDSLSEQEESSLSETDLSETRSCDSRYSTGSNLMKRCSVPVETCSPISVETCSPVYSIKESDMANYGSLGFLTDNPNPNYDDKIQETK